MEFIVACDAQQSDDPYSDLEAAEAAAIAAANIVTHPSNAPSDGAFAEEMHPITGVFTDPSHESAFAAQFYRLAFPVHVVMMVLLLVGGGGVLSSVVVPPSLRETWGMICAALVLTATLLLVGRVLLHRMHDRERSQQIGSRMWLVLLALSSAIRISGYVLGLCGSGVQEDYLVVNLLANLSIALINGSQGMKFAHKTTLIGLLLLRSLSFGAICDSPSLAVVLCAMGAFVLGGSAAHMVEVCLRHSYAEEKVQEKHRLEVEEKLNGEKRQQGERIEQLKAEKERLLYDVQRRGRPLDDDRSAIRRGLQAKLSKACHSANSTSFSSSSTTSEANAPTLSESPPPSFPPGPPSTGTVASKSSSASRGLELVADALADILADEEEEAVLQGIINNPAQQLSTMLAHTNPQMVSQAIVQGAVEKVPQEQQVGKRPSPTAIFSPVWGVPQHKRAQRLTHLEESESLSINPPKPPGSLSQGQSSMFLCGQAVDVAFREIQLVHTDIDTFRVVSTLAMALGAKRMETGTTKAVHAVLLQLVRPSMSNVDACASTAASLSNFTKWKKRVNDVQQANLWRHGTVFPPASSPASTHAPGTAPAPRIVAPVLGLYKAVLEGT